MSTAAAVAAILAFAACLGFFRVDRITRRVGGLSRETLGVLGDGSLGDREKERRLRALSVRLGGSALHILAATAGAAAVPLAAVWGLDALGLVSLSSILERLTRLDVLALATVLGTAIWVLARTLRG